MKNGASAGEISGAHKLRLQCFDCAWPSWFAAIVMCCLAAYIIGSTVFWTIRSLHPIPYWDSWSIVSFLKLQQPVTFRWLFSRHNEHRILIPRLITLADYSLFHGSGYLDIATIWLMQIGSVLLIASLAFEVIGRGSGMCPWRVLVFGLIVALAFSSAQMENFYWAFQTGFIGMMFFTILSFVCLRRIFAKESLFWIAGGAVASVASALCLASGLMTIFIFGLGCLLAGVRRQVLIPMLVLFSIFWIAYLHGNIGTQPTPFLAIESHSAALLGYFFTLMGNFVATEGPFGDANINLAFVVGICGTLAFVIATLMSLNQLRVSDLPCITDPNPRTKGKLPIGPAPAVAALLCIAVVTLAQAVLTTLGRFTLGPEQALSSHYVTPVSLFWITTLVLILRSILQRNNGLILGCFCFAILTLVGFVTERESRLGRAFANRVIDLELAANALRVGVMDLSALGGGITKPFPIPVYPGADPIEDARPFLLQHRLSIFSDARFLMVGKPIDSVGRVESLGPCLGHFDGVANVGVDGGARVSGRAWSIRDGKALREIILADNHGIIVGLATGGIESINFAAPSAESTRTVEWRGYSKYASGVAAYGLFDSNQRVCRLAGSLDVTPTSH